MISNHRDESPRRLITRLQHPRTSASFPFLPATNHAGVLYALDLLPR